MSSRAPEQLERQHEADEVMYPRMSAAKPARLAELGTRRSFPPGGRCTSKGSARLLSWWSSAAGARARPQAGEGVWVAEADAGTFPGNMATLTGEPAIPACVAGEPTGVIAFDRSALRAMLAAWPELAELVLRTMMVRREWRQAHGHGGGPAGLAAGNVERFTGAGVPRGHGLRRRAVPRRGRDRGRRGVLRRPGDADLRSRPDGSVERVPVWAVFVMIGVDPCTGAVHMMLDLDEAGYIRCGDGAADCQGPNRWRPTDRRPHLLETVWPGVFAAGDVRAGATKRVAGAVGDGALAVRFAHQVLQA